MVEREAQLQQEPALDDPAGEPGVARVTADGAEQDGVVLGDGRHVVVGEDVPGLQVPRGTERERGLLDDEVRREDRVQHLERLVHDLRADAVAADHRELDRLRHVRHSPTA